MTEQYIYSRSEREFVNSLNQTIPLGFGFMGLSPGIDKALKRELAVHCEDCPRLSQTDSQGVPLPLFRKTRLPKGKVLLQKSAWIETGSRDFHVAHGYVLDDKDAKEAGPAKWLGAAFRLEDPNAVQGGIPPLESQLELSEPLAFRWLKDAALGLDKEAFCQMLLACFDALASRRQVLIAWDFEQPGEQELRRSVLYWIYTCLPYDLWIHLGFDSVYTDKSSPGLVQLSFVDKASIQDGGQTPSIQLGNQILPLGGNFLVRDGEIIHNDSKYQTAWYHADITYARWLGRLLHMVWNCPEEKREAAVRALEDVRWSLQRQMPPKPEEKPLNPEDYRRACEQIYNLRNLEEAAGLAKPAPPASKRAEPVKKRDPSPAEVYQRIFQRRMQPPTSKELQDLAGIRGEMEPAAIGLLSAFLAREAGMPEAGVTAVLRRCQEQLPANIYAQLPCRLFGDELAAEEQDIWNSCGVESDGEAAKRRRCKWYSEIVAEYNMTADLTAHVRRFLDSLPGLSGDRRDFMENECFQWVFEGILTRCTIPGNPEDIRLLASIRGGWMESAAAGYLGAFMARAADAPEMRLCWVLNFYQKYLQADIYSRLLRGLFWNALTDIERYAWNQCGVENSEGAAKRRRFKWYQENGEIYKPPEDTASFAGRCINMISCIGEQERRNMKEELQMIIKMIAGRL